MREISSLFWRLFGVKISQVSVLKWVRKYSKQVKKFAEMKRPNLSGKWSVDEKFVKIKGKKGYLWLIKDKKRGFIIAKILSEGRKAKNAGKLFKEAKKRGNPKSVTHGLDSADSITDGWIINHDFVKRDRKRNKTNAERCGIKEVPDKTPWLFMIKRAKFLETITTANF